MKDDQDSGSREDIASAELTETKKNHANALLPNLDKWSGWEAWPKAQAGAWGWVYVEPAGRLGYYADDLRCGSKEIGDDDHDDECFSYQDLDDECIVYIDDATKIYSRQDLRQPPRRDKSTSSDEPPTPRPHSPTSPAYAPTSPAHPPTSPPYSPRSPIIMAYSPTPPASSPRT